MSAAARHARLLEIFSAAVDRSTAEQSALLDRECAGDPDLRRDVEDLLAADRAAPVPPESSESTEEIHGTANYRLLHEIGRGGMGVVHLAERSDGAFERRVAVKVLHPRIDDGEVLRRFRAERRILATLDHPNIARILDAGSLDDGSPFLVMEHVEGRPLDRFAEERALSVEARLRLFLGICNGVQAAHQALIVHRDLKPSNVLVTASGEPKLLDFGIAKLLDPARVDWTLAETAHGAQPLTPRYASPEQLGGEPATTATDVYALGVILYELLTGRSPYDTAGASVHAWAVAVCEAESPRPSVAVRTTTGRPTAGSAPPGEPDQLSRRLQGDLDHIVEKALQKEPALRYATAAELAADLRRHLEGRPIHARPPTLRYRTGKFVRRHRWGVVAVTLGVLLFAGFTAGLARQLERTENARDEARTVTELLIRIFDDAGPGTGADADPTAREILDRGTARIRGGLEERPQVKAALLEAIGRVYNNLGRVDEAVAAHEEALELRRPRRDDEPLAYAASLDHLATALVARSELARAEALSREALDLTARTLGDGDPHTLARLDGLQQVLAKAGRFEEAADLARRIVDVTLERRGVSSIDAAIAGASSENEELVGLANTLGSLAAAERQAGDYAAAELILEQAVELNRRIHGEDHYALAFALNNLANVHSSQERHARALDARSEALRIAESALGSDHPSVGSMRLNQSIDLERLGRFAEARTEAERSGELFMARLGPTHPAVALAVSAEGLALLGLGDVDTALERQVRAVKLWPEGAEGEHPDRAQILMALGRAQEALGRMEEAHRSFAEAEEVSARLLSSDHPQTLECRVRASGPLLALGRTRQALDLLRPTVAELERRGDRPLALAEALRRLSQAQDQPPVQSPPEQDVSQLPPSAQE